MKSGLSFYPVDISRDSTKVCEYCSLQFLDPEVANFDGSIATEMLEADVASQRTLI